MKKYLTFLSVIIGFSVYGQTNTFPADGNVGVGTTTPENIDGWNKVLQVIGQQHAKILSSGTNVTAGLWAHDLGYYGAPAGGISGTYTNHPYSFMTNHICRMTISTDGNVAIGNPSPNSYIKLELHENNQGLAFITNQKLTGTWPPVPEATTMTIQSSGWSVGNLAFATGNSEQMRITANGNVGIGTPNPTTKLAVAGTIQAYEVMVQTGWADYVFDSSYELKPLAVIASYIQQNKHLPNIPSAEEVSRNGIALGEMNKKLLEKVEELTLYAIKQSEQIKELQTQNEVLQKQQEEINTLKDAIRKLSSTNSK